MTQISQVQSNPSNRESPVAIATNYEADERVIEKRGLSQLAQEVIDAINDCQIKQEDMPLSPKPVPDKQRRKKQQVDLVPYRDSKYLQKFASTAPIQQGWTKSSRIHTLGSSLDRLSITDTMASA